MEWCSNPLFFCILICENVSFDDVCKICRNCKVDFLFPPCQYSSVYVSDSEFSTHFSSWFQSYIFHRQKQVLFYFQMSCFLSKVDWHISFYIWTPKKEKDVCEVLFHFVFWNFPSCHSKHVFFQKMMLIQKFILDFWTFINVHFFKSPEYFGQLFFGVFFSCFVCFSLRTFSIV